MARKKRSHQNSDQDAHATVQSSGPTVTVVHTSSSVKEMLATALESLDAVAQEAHQYRHRVAKTVGLAAATTTDAQRKRGRDGEPATATATGTIMVTEVSAKAEVFAAMSRLHYATISTAVAALGLQLLPALEDITRRVSVAIATPELASVDSWETAAMLCTYYRSGLTRLHTELLEVLLKQPGVFLLDAPALVPTALYNCIHVDTEAPSDIQGGEAAGTDAPTRGRHAALTADDRAALMYRVSRKLRALRAMIAATGAYVPSATLQQVCLRFAQEVIQQGILAVVQDKTYFLLDDGDVTVTGSGTGKGSVRGGGADLGTQQQQQYPRLMRWRVPVELQPDCLGLLHTLMLTCRPLHPQLTATANRVVREVTASLHRGALVRSSAASAQPPSSASTPENDVALSAQLLPPFTAHSALIAAVVQVEQVLELLYHPSAVPFYVPPQNVMVAPRRMLFTTQQQQQHHQPQDETRAEETSITTTAPATSATALLVHVSAHQAVPNAHPAIPVTSVKPSVSVIPTVSTAAPISKPTAKTTADSDAAKPTAAHSAAKHTPVVPTTPSPLAHVAAHTEESENDIPDIDMDD